MKYYGITDRGKLRKNNQDNYVIATNLNGDVFAIVCDGIGGSRGGDIASHLTVSYFSQVFSTHPGFSSKEEARHWLRQNIFNINQIIFQYGNEHEEFKGLGTTMCGVLISSAGTFVVNIGDSRAYGFTKDGSFRQLTIDHTLIQDMLSHGEITQKEAESYPKKNVLTNALGVWETIRSDVDTHMEELNGFLICSDGLHGYVSESILKEIVLDRKLDPTLRVRKLLKKSLDAGGFDNITIILLDLDGD